jgi:hypothetical protein
MRGSRAARPVSRPAAGSVRLGWLAGIHGMTPRLVLVIAVNWLAAAGLAVIGIPRVDPSLALTPRPMETLGTVGLCLPASLHASLLRDQAPWLAAASPRSRAGLRLAWLAVVVAAGCAGAAGWLVTLPRDVPAGHAFAFWILLLSLSVLSAVMFGHNLAVVLPAVLVAVSSRSALVPFEYNLVFNVGRTGALAGLATAALVAASAAYLRRGVRT